MSEGQDRLLGELTATVKAVEKSLDEFKEETRAERAVIKAMLESKFDRHGSRLSRLERWRAALMAVVSALGLTTLWQMFGGGK